MLFRRYAKGNHRTRNQGMNKLEEAYQQHLEMRKIAGEIIWYDFEKIKLKLAGNTFYTPDFLLMTPDGFLEFHEVKGFMRDDAAVKLKVAAAQFPWILFKLITKDKAGWNIKEIG